MNAALEPARKRLLSVADFHKVGDAGVFAPDERVELIEGELVAMPPIGPAHASLVDDVAGALFEAIGKRAVIRVQGPVRLSDRSEPQPDIALLRSREDRYRTAHPEPGDTLLAIEVADSTLIHDRDVKGPLYAKHGVPETWLIDVQGERLIVYRQPSERGYAREFVQRPPGTLEPVSFPDVTVDLSVLFGKR